jgi:23S rRNA (cytidine2498-2'-O)-methyltransferase
MFVLDTYRIMMTAAPEATAAALDELRFGRHSIGTSELAPGVVLVELEQPLDEWQADLAKRPPVFVRHLAPVHRELVLDGTPADLERLERVAVLLAEHLPPAESFAIQTRLLVDDDNLPSRFEVNERLATAVAAESGIPLDVRQPAGIISIALGGERAYLGVSPVAFNRSSWAGGAQRFAREQGQISRAEFKLLEAQSVFGFEWPDWGQALDLGAAPGGWTRILRRAGLPVVAIDPAEMDPRLADDPEVRHLQTLAQRFLPTAERFSVIVNDLRMDARDSAWLMNEAAPALDPDGIAVMTLKLPHENFARIAYHALSILRNAYTLAGARQLFHNRSEVTAVLRPKA